MKWRPSAAQRREFAQRMQDPAEKEAYETRKRDKAKKKREGSSFDYETAGGEYVPTRVQYDFVMNHWTGLTIEQETACNMVCMGYACKEKVHHDYIHIVNEMIRTSYP